VGRHPGKTTLISILTGLYNASEGEAILNGFRVGVDMAEVYRSIGSSSATGATGRRMHGRHPLACPCFAAPPTQASARSTTSCGQT